MTKTVTLNLTLEELKTLDKYVELNDETRPLFDKIKNAYPKPETLLDVIRNLGYSYDMCYEIVDAVEEFQKPKEPEKEQQIKELVKESVKWCEEHPNESVEDWVKPQTPEQVADGLKQAFREAIKQNIVSSVDKPKTMTDILYRWWCDVFTSHSDWDMETSIEDLVDRIELFLPKEQSAEGSQNIDTVVAVEGYNDALTKIKSKLRNKK